MGHFSHRVGEELNYSEGLFGGERKQLAEGVGLELLAPLERPIPGPGGDARGVGETLCVTI